MTPFVLAAVVFAATLGAQQDTTRLRWVPNPRTTGGSWVADPGRHLRPATIERIDSIAASLDRETTAQIAVVVLDSLDGLDAQTAAFTLHRRWGVGERARDNGIVLLWAPKPRLTYVSVGYGLEGVLPDAIVGRIQDDSILPHFRSGDFDEGILAGVSALVSVARGETYAGRPAATERDGRSAGFVFSIVGGLAGVAALIFAGGAYARYRPRRCPKGHGRMRRLDEKADDAALERGALVEEQVGSVDYDVWVCDRCDEQLVIPTRKWMSGYHDCPKCKRRTLKKNMKELVAATYERTGRGQLTQSCKHCGWTTTSDVTIPRLERSSSGGGGGSGGFGGGGGSFGGGSSGGGGAGRSY